MTVHADSLWIAPGQESGPGRGAYGGGHHEVGEATALPGEAVDVGSFDCGGAETAEVAVSLVIGEDDDEVRLVGCSCNQGD